MDNPQNVSNYLGTIKPTQPLPKKEIPAHVHETDINKVPQKKNIILVWLLSTITFGIYTSFWYMKKSEEFHNLGTQKKLKPTLPLTLMIINILLVTTIIIFPITITQDTGTFYQHVTSLQGVILFAIGLLFIFKLFFSLLIAFYSRTIIVEALENKGSHTTISSLFTFFFTKLYLQYEINKIMDDKEETPKKGPWTFFAILILVILLGAVLALV